VVVQTFFAMKLIAGGITVQAACIFIALEEKIDYKFPKKKETEQNNHEFESRGLMKNGITSLKKRYTREEEEPNSYWWRSPVRKRRKNQQKITTRQKGKW
jgi:hypothetical protein